MKSFRNRRFWFALSLLIATFVMTGVAWRYAIAIGVQPDGSVVIPTGQALTPAGDHIEVNDRPLGMVVSPDGHTLAVVTGSNFSPRALHIIDVPSKR